MKDKIKVKQILVTKMMNITMRMQLRQIMTWCTSITLLTHQWCSNNLITDILHHTHHLIILSTIVVTECHLCIIILRWITMPLATTLQSIRVRLFRRQALPATSLLSLMLIYLTTISITSTCIQLQQSGTKTNICAIKSICNEILTLKLAAFLMWQVAVVRVRSRHLPLILRIKRRWEADYHLQYLLRLISSKKDISVETWIYRLINRVH